jgi:WD40-like Beta Propeller Repeat
MRRGLWAAMVLVLAALLALTADAAPPPGHGQKIVFGSNRAEGQRDLFVVNEDGTGLRRLTFDGEDYRERGASWSPDGTRIAFAASHDGNFDIYTVDANGGDRRRVTSSPARDDYPQWTSDGRIIFTRGLFSAATSAWIVNADGTGEQQLTLPGHPAAVEVMPRGSKIVYGSEVNGISALHVAQIDGSSDRQITTPPSDGQGDFEPHWSPNGSDIVFLRDHGGVDNDVYVVHSDGSGLKQLTNTPNRVEFWANWSSDGKEVLFQDASSGKLKAIAVDTLAERDVSTTPRAPLSDDFSGPQDSSMWGLFVDPSDAGSATQANGQVLLRINGSATPGGQFNQVAALAFTRCDLAGDYDMQVDYNLVTWPHLGGFYATLTSYFGNSSVGRASVAVPWAPSWHDEQVVSWATDSNASFATTDLSGTLRMVKKNGLIVGYIRDGEGWRPVGSGHSSTDSDVGFQLNSQAAQFGHLDGAVAYDNFRLSSGTFRCPDWWQDFFPDVFYG